ncbi:hypothetical protein SAMN02983003_3453 [Devosia enhydra]|uniref:Uncharacterized protein n=1 Tax=Devosia enhydra TaxID=665118 RepID=A0A1K2I233_9HYPH|nr:hypothetical protein [Devosia enhydra]SFZ86275.1 hypothetical protein SAMN02983003_3453 [Devosia enhydra]
MSQRSHAIVREMGAAVAVLAIYVLTLLLPLHQAAGLQRDLATIGYETVGAWTICAPLAVDDDGDPTTPAALTCPATGVSKQEFVAVLPPAIRLEAPVLSSPIRFELPQPLAPPAVAAHFAQSRAPPVSA